MKIVTHILFLSYNFRIIFLQYIAPWYKMGIKVVKSGAKWIKVVDLYRFICKHQIFVADHLYGGKCMDSGSPDVTVNSWKL